ncbi:trypsin-like serine protease [Streptomyces solincola]|nr:trypsin-like serine protease [Streptomyces solincola]
MQIRTRGGRHKRRMRLALPAVAAVAALTGAGIVVTGSGSAEASQTPQLSAGPSTPAPISQQELSARLAKMLKAGAKNQRSLVRQPDAAAREDAPAAGSGQGKPGARIIGGSTTTISAAPWMAQLYFEDGAGDSYFCGGAVIAPTKIATAAHCVKGVKWYDKGVVVVGTDRTLATPPSPGQTTGLNGGMAIGAHRQWNHPLYDAYSLDNDVAVLTLDTPVPSNVKILPLAQPTDSALYQAGRDGKVYGWGRTSSTVLDSGSPKLKVADADIVSDASCAAAYPDGFIKGHMLCAGAAPTGSDATSETTCNGDSGGPLVVGGKLAGIVSWGDEDCSAKGKFGVYAKATTYSAPIQSRVDDTNWNDDHTADLLARRTSDTSLFSWHSKVTGLTRVANHGDFGGVTLLLQTDLNRDGIQDVLYRTAGGDVYWERFVRAAGEWQQKLVAKGWGKHKQILTPGDVTGDELPDMIAVDSAGTMRIYPGKGDGGFAAPVSVGSGWGAFTMVRGHGDFTADGKADIFARKSDGKTYLYKGTGVAAKPWSASVLVGAFASMNALTTTGDVNSDGHADVFARDTAGKLWLYPGKGNGGFHARVAFGSGWQAYNLFG